MGAIDLGYWVRVRIGILGWHLALPALAGMTSSSRSSIRCRKPNQFHSPHSCCFPLLYTTPSLSPGIYTQSVVTVCSYTVLLHQERRISCSFSIFSINISLFESTKVSGNGIANLLFMYIDIYALKQSRSAFLKYEFAMQGIFQNCMRVLYFSGENMLRIGVCITSPQIEKQYVGVSVLN